MRSPCAGTRAIPMLQPTTTGRPSISSGALMASISLAQNFRSMQQIAVSRHRDHRELVTPETRSDIGVADTRPRSARPRP